MMDTFDRLKQQAVSAGASFVKNLKGKYIKPCEGAEYEYTSNDEDYNEFLKSEGAEPKDYVNIPDVEKVETGTKAEAKNEEKSKILENLGGTLSNKFNQIKTAINETAEKKVTVNKEEFAQIQNSIEMLDSDVKSITETLQALQNISDELEVIKDHTQTLSNESKVSIAATSSAIEKTDANVTALGSQIAEINAVIGELNEKVSSSNSEYDVIKTEIDGLKKTVDSMSADVAEINTTQQMLKSSVLSLASSFDALNRRITTGFVTIGIICAACAAMQIVFNIL